MRKLMLAAYALTVVTGSFRPVPVPAYTCPLPGAFIEGRIHSAWVGVLLNFDGQPGSPHTATVYTTTYPATPPGRGGFSLTTLGEVQAHGAGAGELTAMFIKDKLYIINSRYAPGSNDRQYEYLTIQRFNVRFEKLIPEGEGVLSLSQLPAYQAQPFDCSDADVYVPLHQVIEQDELDALDSRDSGGTATLTCWGQ